MSLDTMTHDQAVSTHAPERYVLGELNDVERDAFEAHYFDCASCFDEIKTGAQFLNHAREVLGPEPEPEKGWFSVLWGDMVRPAPAFVAAMLLCAVGIGVYQQVELTAARQPRITTDPLVVHIGQRGGENRVAEPWSV